MMRDQGMFSLAQRFSRPATFLLLLGVIVTACVSTSFLTLNPPRIPGSAFVGTQSCADCHEGIVNDFASAAHAGLVAESFEIPGSLGCEACHGPGGNHVDSGGETRDIINPGRQPQVCFQCHLDTAAEFRLPHGHPVQQGQVACIDCHDPHTGRHEALLVADFSHAPANAGCIECHQAQAGPFVFAHEAMRDGCTACHLPHGSVNDKLLVARNSNLCLSCHAQQPTSSGALRIGTVDHRHFVTQGTCWSAGCHEAVHGSHVNSHLRY
jgi:predicted CXXCH cytochrome family protein